MSTLPPETWKDIFTIGTASIGAVLGVMNMWNSISARRLRVRVTPQFVFQLDGTPIGVTIEVINLSNFPITVVEAGFEVNGGFRMPNLLDRANLPKRLESRESLSIYFDPRAFLSPAVEKLGSGYVRTACGNRITGNSPAGRQLSDLLSNIVKGRS